MEITKYVNRHTDDLHPKYTTAPDIVTSFANEVEMTGEHLSSTDEIQDCEPDGSKFQEDKL